MKSTAKQLGTVDFIAGYIVDDIMNKIADKVFFNESVKEYVYTFPPMYQNNKEVVETTLMTLKFYGYEAILCKNKAEDDVIYLLISW